MAQIPPPAKVTQALGLVVMDDIQHFHSSPWAVIKHALVGHLEADM